eukprot:TRINITY_DN23096_c0_g1_i3.p1 TRINITY_DN23096_c0_g1~~TRINITY_DN23096_c0_g1_i3.p1  ORF type:complete len:501 (+),score=119.31 TRINITY_DN23096_c0_g1_i3:1394-2896(+)
MFELNYTSFSNESLLGRLPYNLTPFADEQEAAAFAYKVEMHSNRPLPDWVYADLPWPYVVCTPMGFVNLLVAPLVYVGIVALRLYRGRVLVMLCRGKDVFRRLWCLWQLYTSMLLQVPTEVSFTLEPLSKKRAPKADAYCANPADKKAIDEDMTALAAGSLATTGTTSAGGAGGFELAAGFAQSRLTAARLSCLTAAMVICFSVLFLLSAFVCLLLGSSASFATRCGVTAGIAVAEAFLMHAFSCIILDSRGRLTFKMLYTNESSYALALGGVLALGAAAALRPASSTRVGAAEMFYSFTVTLNISVLCGSVLAVLFVCMFISVPGQLLRRFSSLHGTSGQVDARYWLARRVGYLTLPGAILLAALEVGCFIFSLAVTGGRLEQFYPTFVLLSIPVCLLACLMHTWQLLVLWGVRAEADEEVQLQSYLSRSALQKAKVEKTTAETKMSPSSAKNSERATQQERVPLTSQQAARRPGGNDHAAGGQSAAAAALRSADKKME